ncbi:unnamed protein product [Clavelina lepadiformis]|uniref:type I protein arginine methyltransferase n=1 Tax=Clavelina lepadiformis TaxID=159417 RepID=A0ABP0H4C2_CLALP
MSSQANPKHKKVTCNLMSTTNEDYEIEEDWSDDEGAGVWYQQVKCIFTEKLFPSARDYYQFLKHHHSFDIWTLVLVDLNLDFFGYVKLVNYMRVKYQGCDPPTGKELLAVRDQWEDDTFLKPVVEDDLLLQFMIDDGEDDEIEEEMFFDGIYTPKKSNNFSSQDNHDDKLIDTLKAQLQSSENKNRQLTLHLKEANKRIEQMKHFMQDVILKGDIYRPVAACRMEHLEQEEDFEDSGYFGTYSHHDIHAEMLQDKIRTLSYQNAILNNKEAFHDKIVLDVGCGTGILSMFAAKSGAKHVYAVDMSDIAYQAMEIVRENKLEDKITVIKGCIEEVKLPVEKVDIIVSEWMGYFLLYESMLDSVLFATNKWLTLSGIVLPNNCSIMLVAAHDENLFRAQVGYWNDVYGFQMTCIKNASISEASVQVIKPSAIVSDPAEVMQFSLPGVTMKELHYKSEFSLKITKSGKCSAIVGYFDIFFKHGLAYEVSFSTGPFTPPTHWKQTVFFLKNAIDVNEGDMISGYIDCRKNPKDPRSLIVDLTINDTKQSFTIS